MLAQPGFEPGTSRTLHGSANHYATALYKGEIVEKNLCSYNSVIVKLEFH